MKTQKSKCQICGKLCKEIPIMINAKPTFFWEHLRGGYGHPPYPALEWTRKEALEDYRKWGKEYGADDTLTRRRRGRPKKVK